MRMFVKVMRLNNDIVRKPAIKKPRGDLQVSTRLCIFNQ